MTNAIPLEIKRDSLKANAIEGYGSVFGNTDLGGDIVLPGAFAKSIDERTPKMLWGHNPDQVIGAWREASEDGDGLVVRGEFAETDDGQRVRTLVKMGAVDGLSVGFRLLDFDFDKKGNRLIKEAELWEVSVVPFPMNPAATVTAVKSQFSARTFERHLRDVGCSQNEAKRLVSELFGGTSNDNQRDVDDDTLAGGIAALRKSMQSGLSVHHINDLRAKLHV